MIDKIKNFLKINPKKLIQNEKHHQVRRSKQDASSWRAAVMEAEQAWQPYRVKMQNINMDTILNGQVTSAMSKRKNLTLLKDSAILNEAGEIDEKWTKFFKAQWFSLVVNYILDAQAFGYTLVNWSKIENDQIKDLELIKRQLVSPDRRLVSDYEYIYTGRSFDDDEFKDWCLFVGTPTETGASKCGYGYLYKIALYEIYLRILMGGNADYVEIFGQPYRVGRSSKDGEERQALEQVLQQMGSSGWAVLDTTDEIEFIEAGSKGKGYESFDNLEARLNKLISKVILGHADAIDSTPGKLGGANETVQDALKEIESTDNTFVENVINSDFLPKLRSLGFSIPEGFTFKYSNDKEKQEAESKRDESNKLFADYIKTLSDAGFEVDPKDIEERTGLKVQKKPEPKPEKINPAISKKKDVKNFNDMVNDLYSTCNH